MNISRRSLMCGGLGAAVTLPSLSSLALGALRPREKGERVLVVVQLTGGNDGLNTVIPHRQDLYYRLRPTLAVQRGRLHKLDDDHGLHPAMGELAKLYADGQVACINGVGYPGGDRSHFRSMEIWHTADPVGPERGIGWLGRLADQVAARGSGLLPAVHVGSGDLPLALRGESIFPPTVQDAESFRLRPSTADLVGARQALIARGAGSSELLFLRQAASTTYEAARRVQELSRAEGGQDYPGNELGRGLHLIARLVSGGFGARIFHVQLTGFDTHVRQGAKHERLLGVLSRSLGAFQRDLRAQQVDADVCTLVFSEFGRRVAENGSRGTDHGAGAPSFLVGPMVRGGMHGSGPDLSLLEQGDVPHHVDFRCIYRTLEERWMGLSTSNTAEPLDVLE